MYSFIAMRIVPELFRFDHDHPQRISKCFRLAYKETRCHPRDPKASPLWQILDRYYDDFEKSYPEKFEKKYGFFPLSLRFSGRADRCSEKWFEFMSARDPPRPPEIPDEIVYVTIEDTAWDQHGNPGFVG